MSAAWVAASSGQILRSYESSLKSLLQAGAENVKDDTTFQSLALKVAEMRAYIKALAPAEAVQEAKNSMEMATERAQKVQDELEAMPGKNDVRSRLACVPGWLAYQLTSELLPSALVCYRRMKSVRCCHEKEQRSFINKILLQRI